MKLKTKLKNLKPNKLKNYVIDYILENYETDDEIENFFSDLLSHGCQSGMISTLIYYNDTKKFYIEYIDEIQELIERLEDELGESIKADGNRLNFYSWLAFEETARNIAQELKIDY